MCSADWPPSFLTRTALAPKFNVWPRGMNIVFFKLGVKLIKSMNPAWWVERWSDLPPNKPVIIFEDERITYLELHRRVNRTAGWLQSVGIEKGDRVAVLLRNCPEFLDLYLAIISDISIMEGLSPL